MTHDARIAPTPETLAEVTGGQVARDGETVVVGYGPIGYLRLSPTTSIVDGVEVPAARIDGRLTRGNGGHHADLRARLAAAGIESR